MASHADTITDEFRLHARVSVLEQQIVGLDEKINGQKEATALALAAADKAIINAVVVADKAVAKVELAAEKTMLTASIEALKEMFNQQIAHQKELTSQALASADKAVAKAESAATTRFESVNEFRATLSDQQRDLATKTEVNLRFKALEDRINGVVEDNRETKGRGVGGHEASVEHRNESTDNRGMVTIAIAIIAVLVAVYSHLVK